MCGAIQLTVDVIIVVQILMYRHNDQGPHHAEHDKSEKKGNQIDATHSL